MGQTLSPSPLPCSPPFPHARPVRPLHRRLRPGPPPRRAMSRTGPSPRSPRCSACRLRRRRFPCQSCGPRCPRPRLLQLLRPLRVQLQPRLQFLRPRHLPPLCPGRRDHGFRSRRVHRHHLPRWHQFPSPHHQRFRLIIPLLLPHPYQQRRPPHRLARFLPPSSVPRTTARTFPPRAKGPPGASQTPAA